jgi:hypothetical protein
LYCEQITYQGIEKGSKEKFMGIDPSWLPAAENINAGDQPTRRTPEGKGDW